MVDHSILALEFPISIHGTVLSLGPKFQSHPGLPSPTSKQLKNFCPFHVCICSFLYLLLLTTSSMLFFVCIHLCLISPGKTLPTAPPSTAPVKSVHLLWISAAHWFDPSWHWSDDSSLYGGYHVCTCLISCAPVRFWWHGFHLIYSEALWDGGSGLLWVEWCLPKKIYLKS